MSDTSTSGTGGAAAPGWYADPHDARQLRWWSGTTWTEHVSPVATPVVVEQPVAQPPAAPQPAASAPTFSDDALPSRRALRDAASGSAPEAPAAVPTAWSQPTLQPSESYQAPQAEPATYELPPEQNAWNQPIQDAQSQQAEQSEQVQQAGEAGQSDETEAQQPAQHGYTEAPAAAVPSWGQAADQDSQTFQLPPASQVPSVPPAEPEEPLSGLDSLFGSSAVAVESVGSAPVPAEHVASAPVPSVPVDSVPVDSVPVDSVASAPVSSAPVAPSQGGLAAEEPPLASGSVPSAPTGDGTATADGSQWGLVASGRHGKTMPKPSSSSTAWVWVIAVSPLIVAAAVGYLLATNHGVFDAGNWMFLAALVVPYLLVVLAAVADRSRLAALDHERPAPWAWAALTAPVYLIARANVIRREMGGGGVPLIIWGVSVVLSLVGILAYGLLTHHPLLAGLPG